MTNDKTVTMSRELAERLDSPHSSVRNAALESLRRIIAAPVVERQPHAWEIRYKDGDDHQGFVETEERAAYYRAMAYHVIPLYTSPPAPVSVVLPDLSVIREYHHDAAIRLDWYAADADMRKSDSEHYRKRAIFHRDQVATIDKVKELNG